MGDEVGVRCCLACGLSFEQRSNGGFRSHRRFRRTVFWRGSTPRTWFWSSSVHFCGRHSPASGRRRFATGHPICSGNSVYGPTLPWCGRSPGRTAHGFHNSSPAVFVLAIVAHVVYRVFGQIQAVEGFFRFASPDARGYWQSLTSVLLASVRNMNNLLLWSAIPLLYRHWLVLVHEQPSSSLTDGKAARAGVPALGYACAALLLNGISLTLFAVYMSIETVRVMPFLMMRVPAATGAAEILRAVMSWLTVLSWGCQLLLFVRCYVAARRASASAP